jgi:hypothetical protein
MTRFDAMTRKEALEFKRRWQLVNEFIVDEIRYTRPEVRFQQLRTMFAPAHHLNHPDPVRDSELAEVRARWQLLKERFHVSTRS